MLAKPSLQCRPFVETRWPLLRVSSDLHGTAAPPFKRLEAEAEAGAAIFSPRQHPRRQLRLGLPQPRPRLAAAEATAGAAIAGTPPSLAWRRLEVTPVGSRGHRSLARDSSVETLLSADTPRQTLHPSPLRAVRVPPAPACAAAPSTPSKFGLVACGARRPSK